MGMSKDEEKRLAEIKEKIEAAQKKQGLTVAAPAPMNRAERRRQERRSKEYDKRQTFTKREVEVMNNAAYEHGIVFALKAAARINGIGDKRIGQLQNELLAVEFENGITRGEAPKWLGLTAQQIKELD